MIVRLAQASEAFGQLTESKSRLQAFTTVAFALLALAFVGGFAFSWLERESELHRYELNRAIYDSLAGSTDFEYCHHPAFKDVGYCKRHEKLEWQLRLFLDNSGNSLTDREQWTFIGSFFFVLNLASTVGYATQGGPATTGGKFFAVIFGIIGIPLFGCSLLIASSWLLHGAKVAFGRLLGPLGGPEFHRMQLLRLAAILGVLLWFGTALLFSLLEGWSYARSVFFCFMTFSTVGIGADVPDTIVGRIAAVAYVYLTLSLSLGLIRSFNRRRHGEQSPLNPGPEVNTHGREPKVALACFVFVVFLCVCGGLILPSLERHSELHRYERARNIYEGLTEMAEFKGCDDKFIKGMDFCKNVPVFKQRLHRYFGPNSPNSMVDRRHWTGLGSASFVFSLASTIGYGSQTPHTREGQVATVLLGMLVVPLFWYCMLVWGASFRWYVHSFVEKAWTRRWFSWSETRRSVLSLVGAVAVLWFLGSITFFWLEGWDPATAVYFCFVTLTAVGLDNVLPQTLLGRLFMLLYIAVGLTSVASLLEECISTLANKLGMSDEDDHTPPASVRSAPLVASSVAAPAAVSATPQAAAASLP